MSLSTIKKLPLHFRRFFKCRFVSLLPLHSVTFRGLVDDARNSSLKNCRRIYFFQLPLSRPSPFLLQELSQWKIAVMVNVRCSSLCLTSLGLLEQKESQEPLNSSIITHICFFNIAVLVAVISVELHISISYI